MKIRFSLYSLALAFFILANFASLPARADDGKENIVKAAFIFNFIKFVEWPDGKSLSKKSQIDICVIGNSGIIKTSTFFSKASSSKLAISLVSEQNIQNISSHCHILFVSESEDERWSDIFSAIKNQPVLTISDDSGFIERGGMIGFTKDDNKVKIEVNKKAADSAGIKIDSQLLEIAFRVIEK